MKQKDEEGVPTHYLKSDKIDTIVINQIYDMCYNTNGVWCDFTQGSRKFDTCKLFYNRKALSLHIAFSVPSLLLKTRYLRDSESKKGLDILIENTVYDFVYVYHFGFSNFLSKMILLNKNNFQSYYTSKRANANYGLKQTIKAFDKLD